MRKNAFILPAFALVAGIAGLFLRISERRTAFDDITGLVQRGAPITTLLISVTVAVVLVCLAFSIFTGVRYKSSDEYQKAFGPTSILYTFAFSVLSFAWLLAAALSFIIAVSTPDAVAQIYLSALSMLSALSVALLSIWLYKYPKKNAKLFFCAIPPMFLCLWLVLLYRENSSNPVLLDFCYQSLAIIASALAFYYTAGFVYGRPAPGKASFAYLTAVFFCCVTLGDNIPIRQKVVLAVMIIMHLVNAWLMINRLIRKAPMPVLLNSEEE